MRARLLFLLLIDPWGGDVDACGPAGESAAKFERQCRAQQRRGDQQGTLRKCRLETLILCGEHDRLTPVKRHEFMAELMPAATLRIIEGAGHLPTLENPEILTDLLRDWLESVARKG
jgi:pimeloyl-ACP methyl ester carboxylesterase